MCTLDYVPALFREQMHEDDDADADADDDYDADDDADAGSYCDCGSVGLHASRDQTPSQLCTVSLERHCLYRSHYQ